MTGHTYKSRTLFLLGSDVEYISEVNKSGIRTTGTRHDTCIRFKRGKKPKKCRQLGVDIS